MTPKPAFAAMAATFLIGAFAAHGCVDRRHEAATKVYVCDPTTPRPDDVCGDGFMCYKAAQAFGQSVCVPKCDPATPSSCDGVCMENAACLTRCAPTEPGAPDGCPAPLTCIAVGANAGLCLPVKAKCKTSADCADPIFNRCTSDFNGSAGAIGFCVEGDCNRDSAACEPGSACVRKFLPPGIQPKLDVCAPVCDSIRQRKMSGSFSECAPGLSCMTDSFPQVGSAFCAPGFAGWLCVDDYGCSVGACTSWKDIDKLSAISTCSPACTSDDDCVFADRGSDFTGHDVCRNGVCRNLQTVFELMGCLHNGDQCEQDDKPNTDCFVPTADMGTPSGLGAFGGGGLCRRDCRTRDDCAALGKKFSVPVACTPFANVSATPICFPTVPYVTDCEDDLDCYGDLQCMNVGTRKTCTRACDVTSDCESDPALGTFFCAKPANICVPKVQSGDAPPVLDKSVCVSGILGANNVCVGGPRSVCNDNPKLAAGMSGSQCESHLCVVPPGAPFGRCK